MPDHHHIQDEIPAYVAYRLEGQSLEQLETHLRECAICSDMVETWKGIVNALPSGGEALFEPHPDEATLREYAAGRLTSESRRVARHLESCAACELEVSAWKLREAEKGTLPRGETPPGKTARGLAGRRPAALAVAALAGAVAGTAITLLLSPPGIRDGSTVPITTPPSSESPGLSGPIRLFVLTSPLRGGGGNDQIIEVGPEQKVALIAVQPTLADGDRDTGLYAFSIERNSTGTVWSSELPASTIREHLASAGVVTLAVPSEHLRAGDHELVVYPASESKDRAILRIPFTVKRSGPDRGALWEERSRS